MDLLDVTLKVIEVLQEAGITYYVCGSLASSFYGPARSTNDADLVAEVKTEHVAKLVSELSGEFYIDEGMIRRAIARHSSFNVIHFATSHKVDVFIRKVDAYSEAALARRQSVDLSAEPRRSVWLSSAEDTILAKLRCYRLGQENPERQWRDVIGVLKVQSDRLDLDYMRLWAARLGLADLLEKALAEAGLTAQS
jgi:hypothetical protein